jgi:hypothetical protein
MAKVKKMQNGGKSSLGMKSVKAGYDKNPGVTRADIIVAAKKKAKSGMKVKKAKNGSKVDPPTKRGVANMKPVDRKVITEKEVYDEFRPSLRTFMTQSDRKPASDSIIATRMKEGYMNKYDPKTGDFVPGPNYNKPRRVPAQPQRTPLKNGGKTKAKYGKSVKKKK